VSTSNDEARPGGGAAFWAALGVRIEPEPADEDATDLEPELRLEADEAAPATEPRSETVAEASEHALEPEPKAATESFYETAHEAEVAAETTPEAEVYVAPEAEVVLETATAIEVAPAPKSAAAPETEPDAGSGDDFKQVAAQPAPETAIPAQAQASIDELEPQEGDVVDGLAALNETLAENRRARENAPRPEPAWQLAGELSGALPPLKACLEAILMVVDEPVTDVVLAQVVERPKGEVAEALRELAEEYTEQRRGFELREVGIADGSVSGATGWRMYSRPECAPVVERFVRDGQQAKLTQAALETLAVVAYRQPVSRSKVSAIRGVNCDGVMRTLLARGLVEECGTEHETGALLYQTTGYFLERMGLKGLDELPDLAPLLPTAAEIEEEA
jgi:segregation and condensation protein B